MKIPFLSAFIDQKRAQSESRRSERKRLQEEKEKYIKDLETKKTKLETEINSIQTNITALQTRQAELEGLGAIDSSEVGEKQFRLDKVRKQAIEVEIKDGERSVFKKAKVVDKYYLVFNFQRKKEKIVIITAPEKFERVGIPHISIKRGLLYTWIKGEATTHDPYLVSIDLTQVKLTMDLFSAIKEAEMHQEMARASKGNDRKQTLYFLVFSGVIAVVAILTSGGVLN